MVPTTRARGQRALSLHAHPDGDGGQGVHHLAKRRPLLERVDRGVYRRFVPDGAGPSKAAAHVEPATPVARTSPAGEADAFDREIRSIYDRARSEAGYTATMFLRMLSERGGLATAHAPLATPHISDGFTALWSRGRLDLTVGPLVLDPVHRAVHRGGAGRGPLARAGRVPGLTLPGSPDRLTMPSTITDDGRCVRRLGQGLGEDMAATEWPALGDRYRLSEDYVRTVHQLVHGAKAADWQSVTRLLDADDRVSPSSRRPGGRGFTLLHHAAWHGAGSAAQDLVARGAWRAVRDDAGETPADVARHQGHLKLLPLLEAPLDPFTRDGGRGVDRGRVDRHLNDLIESRIRPHLDVIYRPPQTAVLVEIDDRPLWAPVPGMNGGFRIQQAEGHLYVQSWVRVVDGSGEAHVVTQHGFLLVEEGFV